MPIVIRLIGIKLSKNLDLFRPEILRLCKVLYTKQYPNTDFNGEAYRLFLIQCCTLNNSVTHVVEAELEADVECPIDINGIYRLAAADENEDDIINSYYPKSEDFGNLKEPKRA